MAQNNEVHRQRTALAREKKGGNNMTYLETLSNIKRLAKLGCTVKIDDCSFLIDDTGVCSWEAEAIQVKFANEPKDLSFVRKLQFANLCRIKRTTPLAERVVNGEPQFKLPNGKWVDERWNEIRNEWDF